MFWLASALLVAFALAIVLLPLRRGGEREASPRWPARTVTIGLPALAVLIYLGTGNPAALEPASRAQTLVSSASLTRQELPPLIARLEAHLKHATNDGRAWVMLARSNVALDNFDAAVRAYEKALAADRKIAQDPGIWCELADALGMAQGGSLRGRPRALIDRALGMRADHPRALEMAGSAAYEARDYAGALAYWEPLLAQLPRASDAHRELQAAIERTRHLAAP